MEPLFAETETIVGAPSSKLAEIQRWYTKANGFVEAWQVELATDQAPMKNTVVLALSVAQLETKCGDVWPGVHNWGAVQARVPNDKERLVLKSIPPHPRNTAKGQEALRAAVERKEIVAFPGGSLQVDSSPGKGYYWVFFAAFPDDAQGARRFVHVLTARTPRWTALVNPYCTEQELAAAMYQTGYYEGTNDPGTPEGKQANINQYASAMRSWTPSIRKALAAWYPGAVPPDSLATEPDPSSNAWVQWALNRLGVKPPLVEDGIWGPQTKASIAAFQQSRNLKVDGWAGPVTRGALVAALRELKPSQP